MDPEPSPKPEPQPKPEPSILEKVLGERITRLEKDHAKQLADLEARQKSTESSLKEFLEKKPDSAPSPEPSPKLENPLGILDLSEEEIAKL